ncbi:MAG TPA: hypothetical protein VF181_03475 [Balneolaceae bacterium]
MKKTVSYEIELNLISPRKWEGYLKHHSGLPGTSLNIGLAEAFARTGTIMDFKKYVSLSPSEASENTPEAFLVFCGVLGLGHYLSKYSDTRLFLKLKKLSNDPRISVRKAVVMALRIIGQKDKAQLIRDLQGWVTGSYREQHMLVQSLCDCKIKLSEKEASLVLDLLDLITVSMLDDQSLDEGFDLLKKDLSTCWSIIVAMHPRKGKMLMEHWIKENNYTINEIMDANLKILKPLEPEWAEAQLAKLSF